MAGVLPLPACGCAEDRQPQSASNTGVLDGTVGSTPTASATRHRDCSRHGSCRRWSAVPVAIWLIRLMVRMAVSQTAGRGSTPLSATSGPGIPVHAMVRVHGDKRAVVDKFGDLGGTPETRTPQRLYWSAVGAGD